MATLLYSYDACYHNVVALLSGPDPCFLARIGGSDTNAVIDFHRVSREEPEALAAHIRRFLPSVCEHNGFYDLDNPESSYIDYCTTLDRLYRKSKFLFFCNHQLLSLFFKPTLDPAFYVEDFENREHYRAYVETLLGAQPNMIGFPYQFIEKMVFDHATMFRAFSTALEGRRVLVVSPFSESVAANFGNRRHFFRKAYVYPEFELLTVETPITYGGLSPELYPHRNWFETVDALKRSIADLDFDIALMSCGSYAMPLGDFIAEGLGRKAVYVGGVLQLYFGVMGRRYENPFFLDQINRDYFIYPRERARFLGHIPADATARQEAFGAYF